MKNPQQQRSDLEALRQGEGTSDFNSNLTTILELDKLSNFCSMNAISRSVDGILLWFEGVKRMDMIISPLLSEEQEKELATVRINNITPPGMGHNNTVVWVSSWADKISTYERKVRYYINLKGLGVTIKRKDNPSEAGYR